jgi:hypothetical protein
MKALDHQDYAAMGLSAKSKDAWIEMAGWKKGVSGQLRL